MSTNLAIQQETTSLTKEGLDRTREQLNLLEEFVRDVLKQDQDYGVIPGTDKPSLLKPGAANIIAAFQCHSEPTPVTALLDVANNFVAYEHRVDIIHNESGRIVASGMGGCNSHEVKYRYRNVLPTCPDCGKDNIRKSNQGDGFYCWRNTGGCGKNFTADHPVSRAPSGKIENPDPLDQANTIMKMSIKRAEVDAAMKLPGVARFFTQDLEDMERPPERAKEPPAKTRRKAAQQPSKETITTEEAQGLMAYADEVEVPRPDVMAKIRERFDLEGPMQLDNAQLEEMRAFIEGHETVVEGQATMLDNDTMESH